MSETVTAVQPDKATMEKINLYTRRAYKPEEVYTFSVVLCDNEVDRDGECFTKETLEELAKLFVGKTGILDHEPTSKNQTARVFDAAVKEIPGKVTALNEPYAQLTAQAYVPRNDGTKAFIESIESGIRKEVSVGCAVKKRVCSVCGAESCVHVPGKTYNGKRCVRILSGAADAYEFSFVAVPAQRAAGVVKKFSPRFEESEKKKEVKTVYDIVKKLADGEDSVTVAKEELNMLKTELKALFDRAECGDRYRAALCERIYKLSAVAQPEFKRGLTEAITKSLGIAELEEMAAALAKAAERKMPVMPQLAAKTERHERGERRRVPHLKGIIQWHLKTLPRKKGMYGVPGKNFTQVLEELDGSQNYAGTPFAGLDAYQRQLKRFGIRVSGANCDTVEKFSPPPPERGAVPGIRRPRSAPGHGDGVFPAGHRGDCDEDRHARLPHRADGDGF